MKRCEKVFSHKRLSVYKQKDVVVSVHLVVSPAKVNFIQNESLKWLTLYEGYLIRLIKDNTFMLSITKIYFLLMVLKKVQLYMS